MVCERIDGDRGVAGNDNTEIIAVPSCFLR